VLIVLGFVQHRLVQKVGASQAAVARTGQRLQLLEAVGSSLSALEAEIEAGLGQGQTSDLARVVAQFEPVRSSLEMLQQLPTDDLSEKEKAARLNSLIGTQLNAMDKGVEEARRGNFSAAKTRLTGEGTPSAEIRALLDGLTQDEHARLKRQTDEGRRLSTRAATTLGVGSILAIWLVALAGLLVHRQSVEKRWKGVERRVHTRILETLPVGICMMDTAGFVLYTNRALDEMTGFKPEESVGRYFANLHAHPREERDRLIEEITERLQSGGIWEGEFVGLRKGGKTYRCVARAVVIDIAEKPHWVFLQEDLGKVEAPRTEA
jgi:PAS domain S-box-containing protein